MYMHTCACKKRCKISKKLLTAKLFALIFHLFCFLCIKKTFTSSIFISIPTFFVIFVVALQRMLRYE